MTTSPSLIKDRPQLLVAVTLHKLLQRIPKQVFVRIHSKHVVNRNYVEEVLTSRLQVRMVSQEKLPIARRRLVSAFELKEPAEP